MDAPANQSPINPLPPVVVVLFLAVCIPELIFFAGEAGLVGGAQAVGWRSAALQDYAYNADLMGQMFRASVYPAEHLMRLVTYPFVHGSVTEAMFSGVILLALGKFVGEVYRGWEVLAVFFASAIAGALVYTAVAGPNPWLYGAFPGSYGLIGAFTFLLWLNLGRAGANQARAFMLIGFLMGAQLLFSLLFGGGMKWAADLTGFATGFGLSFFVSPGGWAAFLDRIRQR